MSTAPSVCVVKKIMTFVWWTSGPLELRNCKHVFGGHNFKLIAEMISSDFGVFATGAIRMEPDVTTH